MSTLPEPGRMCPLAFVVCEKVVGYAEAIDHYMAVGVTSRIRLAPPGQATKVRVWALLHRNGDRKSRRLSISIYDDKGAVLVPAIDQGATDTSLTNEDLISRSWTMFVMMPANPSGGVHALALDLDGERIAHALFRFDLEAPGAAQQFLA